MNFLFCSLVPYCSSDSWSGTYTAKSDEEFSFHGSYIVEEVIKDIISHGHLDNAKRVLVAGSRWVHRPLSICAVLVACIQASHSVKPLRLNHLATILAQVKNSSQGNSPQHKLARLVWGFVAAVRTS
jgi:hypothetical protein